MDLSKRILTELSERPGRENAQTAHELAITLMGVSSPTTRRQIGRAVADLVDHGEPVCGSYGGVMGYYIPRTEEEAEAVYQSGIRRAKSTFARFGRLAKALRRRFPDKFQTKLCFDIDD